MYAVIRTQTKEKLSKISNITFVILPFYQKIYSSWIAILYFGIYYSWWNQNNVKCVITHNPFLCSEVPVVASLV